MIRYVRGDATHPIDAGRVIVAHICNDIGVWGLGFVLAVSKRWPEAEAAYRLGRDGIRLGTVQFVDVGSDTVVANMIAQYGVRRAGLPPPIRYNALKKCLTLVGDYALTHGSSVHMPRIGCGLACGKWTMVEPIVAETLSDRGVSVTVYDT